MCISISIVYGICIIIAAYLIRLVIHKPIIITYSLVSHMIADGAIQEPYMQKMVTTMLRLLMYALLIVALARPQLIDKSSQVHVEGIDIMIALDASGSMQCFDDVRDRRTRFAVAKAEAIRFAQKRTNDQIGLVLFGKEAVSRCPLTLDKRIIQEIIEKTELGIVDPEATVLSIGLSMAIRRLQQSKAKSKIVVLLTDGEPSPEFDISPDVPITLAKKFNIKVYTIGVGGVDGGLIQDPFFGIRPVGLKVNKALLERIAHETGGKFFMAEKPDDMRRIYDEIDRLEKTETQATVYARYTELCIYPLTGALIALLILLFLQAVVWRFI